MNDSNLIRVALVGLLALVGLPGTVSAQHLSLSAAVDSALAWHPDLAYASALARRAEAEEARARSALLPTLGLQSALTRHQEPMLTTPLHTFDPADIPDFDELLWQSQLGTRYTVTDWGRRSGLIDAAAAGHASARSGAEAAEIDLIVRVAEAYARVISARSLDQATEARVTALSAERARAERALAAGTEPELAMLRAEATLRLAEADRIGTRGTTRLAEQLLARLVGTRSEQVAAATLDSIPIRTAVDEADEGTDHPRVRQARQASDAARARLRSERAPVLPRIELNAGLLQFGTPASTPIFEWQAGLTLSWSLFAGGARQASILRAEADARAAEGALGAIELDIGTAIDGARTRVVEADARVSALAAAVDQWEALRRVEALALEAGSGTQADFLEAEAGLYQARAQEVTARTDAFLARVLWAAAVGDLDREWILRMNGDAR